jgi:hypothetical protein
LSLGYEGDAVVMNVDTPVEGWANFVKARRGHRQQEERANPPSPIRDEPFSSYVSLMLMHFPTIPI